MVITEDIKPHRYRRNVSITEGLDTIRRYGMRKEKGMDCA